MAVGLRRENEKAFLDNLQESISKGTTWERITDLVDLQNSRECQRTHTHSVLMTHTDTIGTLPALDSVTKPQKAKLSVRLYPVALIWLG